MFREAKRTPPCILYMPHIDVWWDNVSDVTKATFSTQLQDLPVTASVLLIASTNSPWNELSEGVKKMFSIINQEVMLSKGFFKFNSVYHYIMRVLQQTV